MRKILFINLNVHLGDLVRSLVIPQNIKKQYPESYLAIFCSGKFSEILYQNPYIDDVFIYPEKQIKQRLANKISEVKIILEDLFPLVSNLKEKEFDLVVNPFFDLGAYLAMLIEPKKIIGRFFNKKGELESIGDKCKTFYDIFLHEKREKRKFNKQRILDIFCDLLLDVNIQVSEENKKVELFFGQKEEICVQKFFKENNIKKEDFKVVLHIGASEEKKTWPKERFAKLADLLAEKKNAKVIIIGSNAEKKSIEKEFVSMCKHKSYSCAGKFNILESAYLIKTADIFVTHDSGPMHIGDAVSAQMICLFGKDTDYVAESMPKSKNAKVIVKENVCDIDVEQVFEIVKDLENIGLI